jgi:hypothetical protein
MRFTMRGPAVLLVTLSLLSGGLATAAPIGFTERSAFDAAAAGLSGLHTLDFESIPAGVLPAGPIQGITFSFSIGGFDPEVVDAFDTTSGTHSLGTTGDGVFLAGDSFTLTFAPTHALGLYVIAVDEILAGDFTLAAPGGSVSSSATTDPGFPGELGDGGKVFFLGLVDTGAAFTTVTFTSVGAPADFLFNIDDIVGQIEAPTPGPTPTPTPTPTPVPEPATLVLLASGLAVAWRLRSKGGDRPS